MAIIYSYPDNTNILLTDLLIGTSTVRIAGKKKNLTKNFTVEALGNFISLSNPPVWGTIVGNLEDQADLWNALESKQGSITLTTNGVDGPSTFISDVLNIPDYSAGVEIPTLAQVLLAGNTATNNITLIGNVTATSFIKSGGTNLQYLMADGSVTTGGGAQTLQQVTDAGNTTTNEIIVNNGTYESYIGFDGGIYSRNIPNNIFVGIGSDFGLGILSNGFDVLLFVEDIPTHNINFYLPVLKAGAAYTLATTDDIPSVTPAALTKTDDTNVTLTLGGAPTTALLEATSLTLGWTGTLADSRITSASIWNAKQNAITTGTTAQYFRGDLSLATFPTIPTVGTWGALNYPSWTTGTPFVKMTAAGTFALDTNTYLTAAVTSVGLSMPSAFTVSNSPITGAGVIAVSGAGTSSQYIRGDGQLAAMPSGGGGGSSVNYYLNGSVASSVAGYQQLGNVAIIGGGTDFTRTGNGLIKQFLTDVGNPNRIEIPGGAWNFEMWFSISSSGGNTKFYVELLKYDGSIFTTIASTSAVPEAITGGTTIDLYLTSLAVPTTTLLTTDRLAIRVYIVDNSGGRTVTLHTEDNHLCEILTTFSSGVTSLNGLTANTQYLATGTTGTDFNISSITDTHTFNLPDASATARGLVTINGQTLAGAKTFSTAPILSSLTASQLLALDASKNIQSLNGTGLVKLTAGAISYDVNNYVKAIVKDAVQKTVTGAVGTIIISGYLIPANTFVAGDALKIDPSMFTRSGTSSMVISIYINSSLSLIGAARLAQSNTINATQVFTLFTRHYALDGTDLKGFPNILSTSEIGANSNPMLSTPYDLTQDKYIIFTITPANSTDIAIQQYVNITN